ncbi:MAG TPA: HD domain-containing protein [Acidobacteriaceae bacterium]
MPTHSGGDEFGRALRAVYDQRLADLRARFEQDRDGLAAVSARSAAVDALVAALWARETEQAPGPTRRICLAAIGGYGRQQLFPFSDVDILICTEKTAAPEAAAAIRRFTQALWDSGLRASAASRPLGDCERFKASDPEGSLALLDLRCLTGDATLYAALETRLLGKRSSRETRALAGAAAELTRERHARFGGTLFHLEPNLKDAPGGLRDAHIVQWLARLRDAPIADPAFDEALVFIVAVRVFLHLRHGRDDNTLDWHAQDEAALRGIGLPQRSPATPHNPDPAYWMRFYFRHARALQRALEQELDLSGLQPKPSRSASRAKAPPRAGFTVADGVLSLKLARPDLDPATDPEIVLEAFGLIAETGVRLAAASEERIATAIPAISTTLEDGPRLWSRLCRILSGRFAGTALRSMHALGLLELIAPEFHGIDALVIRDAYHRYTVDEHTFVLLDALHALADDPPPGAPDWRLRFGNILRDLPHPELLFLAALLHDTGKGRSTEDHAHASAQLAETLCTRLELEPFDRNLVVRLIASHLEMSAALRRDIFDAETVRVFAEKIGTHDLLRMLTLFTYADISAVHPDALTPWKAENLWRLSMASENQLDRTVDEDRVHAGEAASSREAASIARALGMSASQKAGLEQFLDGIPERYLRTRSPETIRKHMQLAETAHAGHVVLQSAPGSAELTIVAGNRRRLFADLTAALSGWGMNIVSAEAFSNAHGTVVDTFRFTDPYKTLELNPEERERFRKSLEGVIAGTLPIDALLNGRKKAPGAKPRRVVQTRIEFDNMSSPGSTLMQVVAQDEPGLLRAASVVLSDFGCSVEVALIDTEGDMAIDVFYLTLNGHKLNESEQMALRAQLDASITWYPGNR